MPYDITKYSFDQAKRLGVHIQPSTLKNYKIDVFDKDGNYKTSIGDCRYSDFPHYIESHGIDYAKKRQSLYHSRHYHDNSERGILAIKILW